MDLDPPQSTTGATSAMMEEHVVAEEGPGTAATDLEHIVGQNGVSGESLGSRMDLDDVVDARPLVTSSTVETTTTMTDSAQASQIVVEDTRVTTAAPDASGMDIETVHTQTVMTSAPVDSTKGNQLVAKSDMFTAAAESLRQEDRAEGSSTHVQVADTPIQVSRPDLGAQLTSLNARIVRSSSPPRMARTGYVYDPLMMLHAPDGYIPTGDDILDCGAGHPEEPMRIKRIFSRLAESGLIKRMKKLDFGQVTYDQALLVHSEEHWNKVQGTEVLTDQYIQESKTYYDQLSLYVCRETAHCARLSCGGVIQACVSVCKGEVRNAFAIVRPPGHHAEPEEHMGFCFYNNVAVAAKEVIKQNIAKKVLILDWDVHHGNGTQRAFWDDPNVLYISIHRHDGGKFYPTSDFGALDMVGAGAGEGRTVNIPWPSGGFGDGDYIYAFQKIVMPIAYEFAPDLVIISAGFDAALGDALGQCNVTPPAYGHMTHMLCALAGGKVVVALEGGYHLEAISRSSLAVAQVLLGETPANLGALEASEVATEVMHQVAKVQSKYWRSIDPKSCEPPEVTASGEEKMVIPIPDLLKIHRAHHMFTKHSMFQIPLASSELEEAFGGQVICSEGVYEEGENSTLVVFAHDFGNLRVETDGVTTTNVHLTNSYLLDTSDKVVNWVTENNFSLIDVNVLAQFPTEFARTGPKMISKQGPKNEGLLMRYVWDNYIELSAAKNVIFIGHGTGCGAIMELINRREVERKVKAVVQVAGMHSLVRIDPENESRRDWFRRSNRIFVPSTHPVLDDDRVRKRLGGQVFTSPQSKVVDVLVDVFSDVQTFVKSKLPVPPVAPIHNGHADVIPPVIPPTTLVI